VRDLEAAPQQFGEFLFHFTGRSLTTRLVRVSAT
jgi:hypothetical protein